MILVDEKECMALLKKHRFRDLKKIFETSGKRCENCKHFVHEEDGTACRELIEFTNANEYCELWERKDDIDK